MMLSNVLFQSPFVADLSKHVFSLDNEAMEELAFFLQVKAAPSITTQSTHLHYYEAAKTIKSSLLARDIAHSAIGVQYYCK